MMSKCWKFIENIIKFFLYKILHLHLSEEKEEAVFQFFKFGLVGILNTLISYMVYIVLIHWGVYYILANILGFTVSVINSFYWNNKYVFVEDESKKRVWWKTFIKTYISYAGTGIILSNILLYIWVECCHLPEYIGPIINLFVTIPINFVVNKLWAYRSKTYER